LTVVVEARRKVLLDVEQWAEIRRMRFVEGLAIREIARRTGRDRKTVQRAVRSSEPPRYRRPSAGSKLDLVRGEIHRLLRADPRLPGTRVRELIAELGCEASKTLVDNYLREVRPLYLPSRTYQRTQYRPGEICQFDLFEPKELVPVGYGQSRRAWVLVAALCFSRVMAGALVFSKEASDVLWALGRCLQRLGGLPELLVTDREGCLHAGSGRPTDEFAAFCGQLAVGWHFCDPGDAEAKGLIENRQRLLRSSFEPGRSFVNHLHFQEELDRWVDRRANGQTHRTLRCRPVDRLSQEQERMRPLPVVMPDTDRRWVRRVSPDPYLRFDTNDYSLDPSLVGRRIEARASQRELIAVALDTGELACRHERLFARHRTVTALEHARAVRQLRGGPTEPEVEIRPLARYDALIPA
jgi:transposase